MQSNPVLQQNEAWINFPRNATVPGWQPAGRRSSWAPRTGLESGRSCRAGPGMPTGQGTGGVHLRPLALALPGWTFPPPQASRGSCFSGPFTRPRPWSPPWRGSVLHEQAAKLPLFLVPRCPGGIPSHRPANLFVCAVMDPHLGVWGQGLLRAALFPKANQAALSTSWGTRH